MRRPHLPSILTLALMILICATPLSPALAVSPLTGNQTPPASRARLGALPALEMRLGAFQQARLVAPDARALDEFGWSVAISGYTAVVGARNADPDLGGGPLANAGAAYVFVRSGANWIQEARLTARDARAGDTFGVSVAMDGNTIVVGATGCDVDGEEDAGCAYVFTRQGINWTQKAKLTAADASAGDNFGSAVAVDDFTIVVGADGKDPGGMLVEGGAAYVFLLRGNSWDQKAKLLASDADVGDYFGSAVAISGNHIVVGATEANLTGRRGAGKAYVFTGSGNTWVEAARLTAGEGRSGDYFGRSVAISGGTVVVGALFSDPDLGAGRITNAGAAYVFNLHAGDWQQQAKLVAEDAHSFDQFGQSVSVSGGRVVVGANGAGQAGYAAAGAAYVFVSDGKDWRQQTRIVADFAFDNDNFGQSVAISGDYVVVGANGMDPGVLSKAGQAFVFQLASVALPETGFAPGRVTPLAVQPSAKAYSSLGELWLEIPALGVKTSIVGVSQGRDGWDVSWLWDQAGYLEGTAFPTWSGNTGIVGHAYLPNGEPGPFADLKQLQWGNQIIIHAWGQRYLYQVRQVSHVLPTRLDVLEHTKEDWLTLITCEGFDPISEQFRQRLVVRSVLTSIEGE